MGASGISRIVFALSHPKPLTIMRPASAALAFPGVPVLHRAKFAADQRTIGVQGAAGDHAATERPRDPLDPGHLAAIGGGRDRLPGCAMVESDVGARRPDGGISRAGGQCGFRTDQLDVGPRAVCGRGGGGLLSGRNRKVCRSCSGFCVDIPLRPGIDRAEHAAALWRLRRYADGTVGGAGSHEQQVLVTAVSWVRHGPVPVEQPDLLGFDLWHQKAAHTLRKSTSPTT